MLKTGEKKETLYINNNEMRLKEVTDKELLFEAMNRGLINGDPIRMQEGAAIAINGGQRFNYADPSLEGVDIEDLASALAKMNRYSGHTNQMYTVAQHSLIVSNFVGPDIETQLWGLLHDIGEIFIGDIPSPFKNMIPAIEEYEMKILRVVAEKYDLCWPIPDRVFEVDKKVYGWERFTVAQNSLIDTTQFTEPPITIDWYEKYWKYVKRDYVKRFNYLMETRDLQNG